jgi:glutamate synthase (NADPH) large chain
LDKTMSHSELNALNLSPADLSADPQLAAFKDGTVNGVSPYPDEDKLPGMYDPELQRDACGVGFIVDLKGRRRHPAAATASSRTHWRSWRTSNIAALSGLIHWRAMAPGF